MDGQKDGQKNKNKLIKNQQKIVLKNSTLVFNEIETGMNRELFQKHFSFSMPSAMLRDLFCANDKRKTEN